MKMLKRLLICLTIITSILPVHAQKKPPQNKKSIIEKLKLPVLKTHLGNFVDSSRASVEEVLKVIDAPLIVTDEHNKNYTVTYYQVIFKRRAVREDEATGKVIPTTSIASEYFKTTPLSKLWITKIREDLKEGEELYFFDIIVKDEKGTVLYAPDLKILTQ